MVLKKKQLHGWVSAPHCPSSPPPYCKTLAFAHLSCSLRLTSAPWPNRSTSPMSASRASFPPSPASAASWSRGPYSRLQILTELRRLLFHPSLVLVYRVRYSDFIVNEVDVDGNIVHLTSFDLPLEVASELQSCCCCFMCVCVCFPAFDGLFVLRWAICLGYGGRSRRRCLLRRQRLHLSDRIVSIAMRWGWCWCIEGVYCESFFLGKGCTACHACSRSWQGPSSSWFHNFHFFFSISLFLADFFFSLFPWILGSSQLL